MENEQINQERIHDLIFKDDDVKWQTLLGDLVRSNKLDPWDLDISLLANEYIKMIQQLQELNFKLSGKVILAVAVLLKMKSDRLDMESILALADPEEYADGELLDPELAGMEKTFTKAKLDARIPIPRQRKVTIVELISALKKALEVEERRVFRHRERIESQTETKLELKSNIDIFDKIEEVYMRVKKFLSTKDSRILKFYEDLVPSKIKEDVIWTFIPLLHLEQQGYVELTQNESFGEIAVEIKKEEEYSKPTDLKNKPRVYKL